MGRCASMLGRFLIGACALSLGIGVPPVAWARPVVEFKAAAVPIPVDPSNPHGATYPGTGDILGAGAAGAAEWKISGTEYGGGPSPLTWIKVFTPAGVKLHPHSFGICSEAILSAKGVEGCPRHSLAGWGAGTGVVTFGGTRVAETATVNVLFRPGGLIFFVRGVSPTLIELMSEGTILDAGPAFGQLFTGEVPLVKSVPEALDGSVERLRIVIGAAYEKNKKLISYITLPSTCPRGGYTERTELSFLNGETVPVTEKVACPKRRR
jgi:hypothetical protein